MDDLKSLSDDQLTDLLAEKTFQYTKMFREGIKDAEFFTCKLLIDQLADEIQHRKKIKQDHEKRNN